MKAAVIVGLCAGVLALAGGGYAVGQRLGVGKPAPELVIEWTGQEEGFKGYYLYGKVRNISKKALAFSRLEGELDTFAQGGIQTNGRTFYPIPVQNPAYLNWAAERRRTLSDPLGNSIADHPYEWEENVQVTLNPGDIWRFRVANTTPRAPYRMRAVTPTGQVINATESAP